MPVGNKDKIDVNIDGTYIIVSVIQLNPYSSQCTISGVQSINKKWYLITSEILVATASFCITYRKKNHI